MRSTTIAISFAVWSWYDSRFGWKAVEYMLGLMEVMAIARETRSHCSPEGENGHVFASKDVAFIPFECFTETVAVQLLSHV